MRAVDRRRGCPAIVRLALLVASTTATSWLDLYESRGYFVLPNVIRAERVAEMSNRVLDHLKSTGETHKYMMNGKKLGGWFIPGIERIAALRDFEHEIAHDERLAKLQQELADVRAERTVYSVKKTFFGTI